MLRTNYVFKAVNEKDGIMCECFINNPSRPFQLDMTLHI